MGPVAAKATWRVVAEPGMEDSLAWGHAGSPCFCVVHFVALSFQLIPGCAIGSEPDVVRLQPHLWPSLIQGAWGHCAMQGQHVVCPTTAHARLCGGARCRRCVRIAHSTRLRATAWLRLSIADPDAELEKRLEKLRTAKGATPYGQGSAKKPAAPAFSEEKTPKKTGAAWMHACWSRLHASMPAPYITSMRTLSRETRARAGAWVADITA